jgi:hypothetical protein
MFVRGRLLYLDGEISTSHAELIYANMNSILAI